MKWNTAQCGQHTLRPLYWLGRTNTRMHEVTSGKLLLNCFSFQPTSDLCRNCLWFKSLHHRVVTVSSNRLNLSIYKTDCFLKWIRATVISFYRCEWCNIASRLTLQVVIPRIPARFLSWVYYLEFFLVDSIISSRKSLNSEVRLPTPLSTDICAYGMANH